MSLYPNFSILKKEKEQEAGNCKKKGRKKERKRRGSRKEEKLRSKSYEKRIDSSFFSFLISIQVFHYHLPPHFSFLYFFLVALIKWRETFVSRMRGEKRETSEIEKEARKWEWRRKQERKGVQNVCNRCRKRKVDDDSYSYFSTWINCTLKCMKKFTFFNQQSDDDENEEEKRDVSKEEGWVWRRWERWEKLVERRRS